MTFRPAVALAALSLAGAAQAHVSLVGGQALPGVTQILVVHVSHGCKGEPTSALRIALPAGVVAQPIAKPGWTVERAPAAVTWRGRSPERQPDDFEMKVRLPRTHGALYFPAVQTCGGQTVRWDQVPVAGATDAFDHPAPTLLLTDHPVQGPAMDMGHGDHAMTPTSLPAPPAVGAEPPRLRIVSAWSRPTPNGAPTAAGYLTIVNSGKGGDRLLGGSSPLVRAIEIHQMSMDGGVMRMRPAPTGVAVAPGGRLVLGPGGYHLMLIGPKRPFKAGDKVPIALRFQRAGVLAAVLDVGSGPGA